jgi:predicted KAP-like P-loop ATPase
MTDHPPSPALWADNETTTDLLGFAPWVKTVAGLVVAPDMLPLTVGIFSDWGGGKTSLMAMLRADLAKREGIVLVDFQPWLHRSYDDVRGALMVAIVDALNAEIPVWEKAGKHIGTEAKEQLKKFARRIDWLRLTKFGFKIGGALATIVHAPPASIALAAGALSDLPHLLTEAESEVASAELLKPEERSSTLSEATPPVERAIAEFRQEFKQLLDHLKVESLVVLVDDIDRCSPSAILDTLEAIKLFFAVPHTAFVIGADQRIIRHALEARYPETGELAATLGREYLEKIIQLPIQIPPLTPPELESYMYLLVVERHLGRGPRKSEFLDFRDKVLARSRSGFGGASVNYGIVNDLLGTIPDKLQKDLAIIAQVAPVLAPQLKGNPRQAKRFLNLIFLREQLANAMALPIDMPVLAKLSALEYFDEGAFSQIATWNAEAPGSSSQIRWLESFLAGESVPDIKERENLEAFAARSKIKAWLQSAPSIGTVDIGPYVTFARQKVRGLGTFEQALPQALQHIVAGMLDEAVAVATEARTRANGLPPDQQELIFAALLSRVPQGEVSPELVDAILGVVKATPSRAGAFASALEAAAPDNLPNDLPMTIRARIPESLPAFRQLFERWAELAKPEMLSRVARRVLKPQQPHRPS